MRDEWMEENWGTVGHSDRYTSISDIDDNMQDIEDYHSELLDSFEEEEEDEEEEDGDNNSNSISY
jgi:hypothetical protein